MPTIDRSAIVMSALGLQSDDEHVAVAVLQHLDWRVVEPAQAFGRDNFVRLTDRKPAVRNVENAINDRQQWVDVMCDEQDGEAIGLSQGCDQFGNHDLISQVEEGERLL